MDQNPHDARRILQHLWQLVVYPLYRELWDGLWHRILGQVRKDSAKPFPCRSRCCHRILHSSPHPYAKGHQRCRYWPCANHGRCPWQHYRQRFLWVNLQPFNGPGCPTLPRRGWLRQLPAWAGGRHVLLPANRRAFPWLVPNLGWTGFRLLPPSIQLCRCSYILRRYLYSSVPAQALCSRLVLQPQ